MFRHLGEQADLEVANKTGRTSNVISGWSNNEDEDILSRTSNLSRMITKKTKSKMSLYQKAESMRPYDHGRDSGRASGDDEIINNFK